MMTNSIEVIREISTLNGIVHEELERLLLITIREKIEGYLVIEKYEKYRVFIRTTNRLYLFRNDGDDFISSSFFLLNEIATYRINHLYESDTTALEMTFRRDKLFIVEYSYVDMDDLKAREFFQNLEKIFLENRKKNE